MKIDLIYATWPEKISGRSWSAMPEAFRHAGLAAALTAGGHAVAESDLWSDGTLTGAFGLAGQIGNVIRTAQSRGSMPVVVCGSCTVAAVGGIAGLEPAAAILWMDAHPDLNTPETTRSGLFEGMALATATGLCWTAIAAETSGLTPASPRNAILFGARDIDAPESEIIARTGMGQARDEAEIAARIEGGTPVYVHLDMDVHDGLRLRTNAYAVPGGPTVSEVRSALRTIANGPIGAIALTGLETDSADVREGVAVATEHIRAVAEARSAR
jgi:arginase